MLEQADDMLLVVRRSEVLVERHADALRLCSSEAARAVAEEPIWLGSFAGRACYAAGARSEATLPDGVSFTSARSLFAELSEATLDVVGRALACIEFEDTHRFCGRCARATEASSVAPDSRKPTAGERTRVCRSCDLTFHPRIPPAVIVLVERGDEILLARSARFPPGLFSAVAGFVEIGESLESALHREVEEEVGVKIRNLRYFASQPWPFGHSLMLAFHAEYAGGELRPDGTEIAEAAWFARDRLPLLPPRVSIARKLIDAFVARASHT